MRPRDPFTVALILLVYVLPVGGATVSLVAVGLPVLAVALITVEAVVAVAVVLARRSPG